MLRLLLLTAALLSFTSSYALARDAWWHKCALKYGSDHSGTGYCLSSYVNILKSRQSKIIKEIQNSLNASDRDGTNYALAKIKLKKSQKNWLAFVDDECGSVYELMGQSANGAAFEEMECVIERYETRNTQLLMFQNRLLSGLTHHSSGTPNGAP